MRLPPATGGSLVSSLDNYHREIIDRVQTGDLQLGVSKMAGADRRSIAFSKFWTSFPFLAVVSCVGIPWHLESELFWGYVIFSPAIFVVGVLVRRNRGMAKARELAMGCPMGFMYLWDEGARSLRDTHTDEICLSLRDDYCAFRRSRSVIPWEADQSFQFKPITEHARVAGCRYCAK